MTEKDLQIQQLKAENKKLTEELEEWKKRGILPPCNVGDTVYYVDDLRKFVDTCKVTGLECKTSNPNYMCVNIELTGKLCHCVGKELFGKDVFLTEQEAQATLEKMKGE